MSPLASTISPLRFTRDSAIVRYGLPTLLGIIVLGYLSLFALALRDGQYMPAWSDEYEYQKNMASFLANGNLITSLALEEHYARLLGSSGHGFAYTLTNGLFARLLGLGSGTIIGINALLILLSTLAIAAAPFLRRAEKLFIAAALLLYPVVIYYTFSYMMELYQLLFGVLLSLAIAGLYRHSRAGTPLLKPILLFYALIIVATLYRQTWALWGIAAIPLAKDRRQIVAYSAAFVLLLAYAYLFSSYFLARYPYDPRIHIFTAFRSGDILKGLSLCGENLLNNGKLFFSVSPLFTKSANLDHDYPLHFLLAGLGLYFAVSGVFGKCRHHLVAAAVIWVNILAMLLLFTAEHYAAQRHLAPVYYFLLVHLALEPRPANRRITMLLFLLQIAISVPVVASTVQAINARKLLAGYRAANAASLNELTGMIAGQIPGSALTTIYVANEIPIDNSPVLDALPTRTAGGAQLRYTMNPLGRNMHLWNRVPVSYLLAPTSVMLTDPNTAFVAESGGISLYRILKIPENGQISAVGLPRP